LVSPIDTHTLWNEATSDTWSNTPLFFQRLIGPAPPTDGELEGIAQAIQFNSLVACSNGACDASINTGSQGWVFGDNIEHILSQGSGPTDGHPLAMSSYRTELSGILVVLYIIGKLLTGNFHTIIH